MVGQGRWRGPVHGMKEVDPLPRKKHESIRKQSVSLGDENSYPKEVPVSPTEPQAPVPMPWLRQFHIHADTVKSWSLMSDSVQRMAGA